MKDVQSLTDLRGKSIYKVGVSDVILPFRVESKYHHLGYQDTVAIASLYGDLHRKIKGTNMSRLIQTLTRGIEDCYDFKVIKDILITTKKHLNCKNSFVEFSFKLFINRQSPVEKKVGYMDFDCTCIGELINGRFRFYLIVNIPYSCVCPCSKEISKYGAHNQRGVATVKVRLHDFNLLIEEFIEKLELCGSCELYPILKRPDEKFVTEKAFENPKFVEDVARDIALELDKMEFKEYYIQTKHYESIHPHNAICIIKRGRITL